MRSGCFKILLSLVVLLSGLQIYAQQSEFQGKAYYYKKSSLELGRWGERMTEAQKKQIEARLKNRLEKTYILTFNRQEAVFNEDQKLGVDAISGATDSWGKNFSPGEQYKNVKTNQLVQSQEFYGKKFLVKDELPEIKWEMGSETKQIGGYTCYQANAMIPASKISWYDFSWEELRKAEEDGDQSEEMVKVTAWYTPQIPVSLGPAEYYGLPGLILEVNANNTTMLCFKVVMNPEEKINIEAPDKGKEVSKQEYKTTITEKMIEMRDNRGRPRGS